MVTAELSPPEHGFSKDRLIYRFVSDDYILSSATYAVNRLYFTGAMPVGITLQFRFNGQVQTFAVSAGATANGTSLPGGNGSVAFATSLIPYFQANTFLSRYFTYSAPNDPDLPSVVFTAKEKGKAYEMVEVVLSFGKIQTMTPATDFVLQPNHCIFLELYLEQTNGSTFTKIYETYLPTSNTGRAEIDLAPVLNPYLQLAVERPNWTLTAVVIGRGSTRRYWVTISEGVGQPLQLRAPVTLSTRRGHYGGSGYNMPAEVSYLMIANAKMRALQNGPALRWVMQDEPSFLTFFNSVENKVNTLLKAQIKWHDATVTTVTLLTVAAWELGQKLLLPAGHNQLQLPTQNTNKRVVEYTLWLQISTTELTERYRYIVDDNLRDRRKYFPYLNSLGGWDVLVAKGVEERTTEFELQTATKQLMYPNQNGDAELFQFAADYHQVFNSNTGYQSREEQKRFRDFVLSPLKYRFFNGQIVPVVLNANRFREGTDADNRLFVAFNYRYGVNSNSLIQQS